MNKARFAIPFIAGADLVGKKQTRFQAHTTFRLVCLKASLPLSLLFFFPSLMKNTLETKSETSDRNDGCPKISHTPSVGVKGRSPVLMEDLMLSPRMLHHQCWGPGQPQLLQQHKTGTELHP